jgi:hypothetical protein
VPPAGHGPFVLWNRSGNRVVRLLLRSRAHGLVSGRLTLITVTGRRTGLEHTLPVAYKQEGERLTIPVMWPDRKLWWRNLRDGAPVRLWHQGVERTGQGRVLGDEHSDVSVEVLLDPAS